MPASPAIAAVLREGACRARTAGDGRLPAAGEPGGVIGALAASPVIAAALCEGACRARTAGGGRLSVATPPGAVEPGMAVGALAAVAGVPGDCRRAEPLNLPPPSCLTIDSINRLYLHAMKNRRAIYDRFPARDRRATGNLLRPADIAVAAVGVAAGAAPARSPHAAANAPWLVP